MPIVTHDREYTTSADGSTSNVLKMYDQDGRVYVQTFFAPANFDVGARINNTIAELDEQLKEDEFRSIVGL